MKRFTVPIVVAFLCFAVGVIATALLFYSATEQIKQPPQNQPLLAESEAPQVISYESARELKIPDLTNARVSLVNKNKNSNALLEALFGVSEKADFSNCEGYENIKKWNGTNPENLYINHILRFSVNKQAWLYRIPANPPGISVTFQFDYIDEDGDGKFDKCAASSLNAFKMPQWAQAKMTKSVGIKSKTNQK